MLFESRELDAIDDLPPKEDEDDDCRNHGNGSSCHQPCPIGRTLWGLIAEDCKGDGQHTDRFIPPYQEGPQVFVPTLDENQNGNRQNGTLHEGQCYPPKDAEARCPV